MRVSSHAIALIQNFEGLRTKAYKPLSHENGWTIGYGHHSPDVYEGMVCTDAEAELLLKADIAKYEVTTQNGRIPKNSFEYFD